MDLIFIVQVAFLLVVYATLKATSESTEENTNTTNYTFLPFTLNTKGIKESQTGNYQDFYSNVPVEKLESEGVERLSSKDNHHNWKRLSTLISPYPAHKQASIGNTDYVWNQLGNIPQNTNALCGSLGGFLMPKILYYVHLGILSYILFGFGELLSRFLTLGDLLKPPLPFTSADGV